MLSLKKQEVEETVVVLPGPWTLPQPVCNCSCLVPPTQQPQLKRFGCEAADEAEIGAAPAAVAATL